MRKLVHAVAGVLALSPLVVLATVSAPASAAVTHPAAAARAAVPEACSVYKPDNNFGFLYASGTTAGSELYTVVRSSNNTTWCKDLDGVPSGWELLRLDGTSQCAEYSGPAGGGGDVILAACDSHRTAQLWLESGTNGNEIVSNDYPPGCLSSNRDGGNVYMAEPCTGTGGQLWAGWPTP